MRVLLDSCVWGGAAEALEAVGHDVERAASWPTDPGDSEILRRAYEDGRVLVTLDKDFGELAVLHGQPHSGIVRLVGVAAEDQGPVSCRVLAQTADDLLAGGLVTATATRLKIRRGEPRSATATAEGVASLPGSDDAAASPLAAGEASDQSVGKGEAAGSTPVAGEPRGSTPTPADASDQASTEEAPDSGT